MTDTKKLVYEVIYDRLAEIADASNESDFVSAFIGVLARNGTRARVRLIFPKPAKSQATPKRAAKKSTRRR